MQKIATVSQINAYIKHLLDKDIILQNIWIKGEISNFKLHYSGHMYLSLKDDTAVLRAVMFKTANQRMNFVPQNGMKVLARGRISAYERDGQYQLYIEEMIPDGVGELYIAFEQLKAKLDSEGLFSNERKKPIPRFPQSIGIITADKSAALSDMLNILGRRYPLAKIIIYPALVQGEGAAKELKDGVLHFNKEKTDLIIIGRGGGSFEDLGAFNDEELARAVANSAVPVISAVGHETDFTICDFVADLRAATPSEAAERAALPADEIQSYLNGAEERIKLLLSAKLKRQKEKFSLLSSSAGIVHFKRKIDDKRFELDAISDRLCKSFKNYMSAKKEKTGILAASLDALSPLKVLGRGYAVMQKDGKAVKSVAEVSKGDRVNIILSDGSINAEVE